MVRDSDKASLTTRKHFFDAISRGPRGVHLTAQWYRERSLGWTHEHVGKELGVVIDSQFRDLVEYQGIGIKLFARDTSILGSASFIRSS